MTEPTILTWALNEAPDGSPLAKAAPSDVDLERADAVLRLNPSARRYAAEAVRADVTTARRLAAAAIANAYGSAAASWQHVAPADLLPPAPAEAAPERLDLGAVTPGHPRWAAEAREMLRVAALDPHDPRTDPERQALGRRMIERALAEGWTIRRLGHAILTDAAERADAAHVDPRWHAPAPDPIALATGTAPTDHATLWRRVTRPPEPNEVTNASRRAF